MNVWSRHRMSRTYSPLLPKSCVVQGCHHGLHPLAQRCPIEKCKIVKHFCKYMIVRAVSLKRSFVLSVVDLYCMYVL